MVLLSQFTRYLLDNRQHMRASDWRRISLAGRERVLERLQTDCADGPLDFSDLVREAETCISGARK